MNQTMQEQSTAKAHDHPEYSPGLEGVIARRIGDLSGR